MHLIDLLAYSAAIYLILLVVVVVMSLFVKSDAKVWNKINWTSIVIAIVIVTFGWVVKSAGWDPLLW